MQQTFHDFEHAGWQMVADTYQRHFGSLTSQTIEPLLDAVNAGATGRLLDIATGPGYVAAAAAARGADVLGIDFSSTMVTMARRMQPDISFAEGDAENLSFADCSFDSVTMNFGILHLERPEQALGEVYRVLKPGGRFAFSIWGRPEDSHGFRIVLDAIKEHGDPSVALPQGPPFFRFSDIDESSNELQRAGFAEINCSRVSMSWKLSSEDDFFNAFYCGTPRTGGTLRAQSQEQLQAIRQKITQTLESYKHRDAAGTSYLQVPMLALVFHGMRSQDQQAI